MNKKLFLLNLVFLFTIFSCAKISELEIEQFHNAVRSGDMEAVTIIIENEDYKDNKRKIAKLINSKNENGNTSLHLVIALQADGDKKARLVEDYQNIARLLIKNGADVNSKNNNGDTPLHLATAGYITRDAIILLAQNGAALNETNNKGQTPLDNVFFSRFDSPYDIEKLLRLSGAKRSNEI